MGSDEAFDKAFEKRATTFDEIEHILMTTKSEWEAQAMRKEIEKAFVEREELRVRVAMMESAKPKSEPQPMIFNIDKQETRNAIMAAMQSNAPAIGCGFAQPEVTLQFENGVVMHRAVTLPGYGEMSPDDAEGLVFALYAMVVRARAS